jgi:hypothetical protein
VASYPIACSFAPAEAVEALFFCLPCFSEVFILQLSWYICNVSFQHC